MKTKKYTETVELVEHNWYNPGVHFSEVIKGVERRADGSWGWFVDAVEKDNLLGWVGVRYTVKSGTLSSIEGYDRARTVVLRNLTLRREWRRGAPMRALEAHEAKVAAEAAAEKARLEYEVLKGQMRELGFTPFRNGWHPAGQVKGRGVVISYQPGEAARWCVDSHGCRLPQGFKTATDAAAWVNDRREKFNIEISPTAQ